MDKILVLDFGSQTTQLIARRVRELNVYSEIHPFNLQFDKIKGFNPTGIILSGSPARVIDKDVPHIDMRILELGVPVLGICYGMQEMARVLGGEVAAAPRREYGFAEIDISSDSALLSKLAAGSSANRATVWMSHNDVVSKVPKGFKISSSTADCKIASMEDYAGRLFGTQFHPEVTHTKIGVKLLEKFVIDICKCRREWTMKSFIDNEIERIKAKVQNERVVLGLSGGVDSSVAAALIQKAIGERLTCIFVDNGLLRKNEA
ncbi:MAG: glutamine-hydrolyzing GMP synthase, partial [Deltaproteobacteria bacterium]|nr:glutamine-hydrolyzing GMP synthase [Deltaproteobacteria bacterium]